MFLYKNNDNVVKLYSVKNNVLDEYINSSSNVTAKLETEDGTELVEAQTLSYVAASNGNYRGIWDKALISSVANGVHRLVFTVAESGLDLEIKASVTVKDRES